VQTLSPHRPLEIGAIKVEPFPVPHDAREPCQFVFAAGGRRLALHVCSEPRLADGDPG